MLEVVQEIIGDPIIVVLAGLIMAAIGVGWKLARRMERRSQRHEVKRAVDHRALKGW
jgi:hypothetical protein